LELGRLVLLFNSYEFIFLFFPFCVFGYFVCTRFFSLETALGFLVFASLVFYAYWKPVFLVLLIFSISFNFLIGRMLSRGGGRGRLFFVVFGVAGNLALLAYFKYANFFFDNIDAMLDTQWNIGNVFLPLAISFFTLQQISYLVDAYRGETREYSFLRYSLFVCFFPQLIAGPIVRHREIVPQFLCKENIVPKWSNFAVGISIFAIGLFKKTVIADSLSQYVGPVFDAGKAAPNVDFFRAWGSSLAYTFQLYFDFSAYSDMAIGAARIFGVRLPVNFFSPYKSTSIIEFWQRWHVTFSRFLRDYLYIPLGGSRKGKRRGYVNLFITMLLAGVWHSAGWPFIIWGGLQGGYLIVNHAWRQLIGSWGLDCSRHLLYRIFCWAITFAAIVFSWVYFRAPTLEHGNQIALAMLGLSGFEIPVGILARAGKLGEIITAMGVVPALGGGAVLVTNIIWVLASFLIVLMLPNVAQIFSRHEPVLYESERAFQGIREVKIMNWDYRNLWAVAVVVMGVAGVLTLQRVSEFLYFQF
jgi:alginate O-acetyltransferase complex protein AlgI